MTLVFVDRDHALRHLAELKIAAAFRAAYGADIGSFAPMLVVEIGAGGEIESIAGLRLLPRLVDRAMAKCLGQFRAQSP